MAAARPSPVLPALLAAALLAPAGAAAQEGEAASRFTEVVESLSEAIQTLSETIARQERRIAALEENVRAMTGAAEETRHSLEQAQARLDALEAAPPPAAPPGPAAGIAAAPPPPAAGGAPAPLVIPDPSVAANPTAGVLGVAPSGDGAAAGEPPAAGAPPPFDDPAEQYKRAYELLSRADYAAAEQAFEAFLRDHPDDPLTDNAYYWLGETYYVRKQFERAASSFARGYQADPSEPKAPDMLLKLGLSLVALGRNEDACSTFQRLETNYEDLAPRTVKRLQEGRDRASCG